MVKRQGAPEEVVPEAFFFGIAYLLPGLNQVAQRCGISIGEWIILFYLKEAGAMNDKSQCTMMRKRLTELLSKRGFGDANISRLLKGLEDKNLIRRMSLPYRELVQLFDASHGGSRQAVVLQATGEKKIQEFKQRLASLIVAWRSEQSLMVRKALESANGVGLLLAEWFFKGTPPKIK
jgi:DNA-binding MarR family transcriptional regulator